MRKNYPQIKRIFLLLLVSVCLIMTYACSSDTGAVAEHSESSSFFDLSQIPAYSGKAYVTVNDNVPYFTEDEMTTESYEFYSELDTLGRCGVCAASIGRNLMPTGERGEIGSVRPTGWHTVKYQGVIDRDYLYNRCHLIGWQLTGENANVKNLITGTRYMNTIGMNPFENRVADYIRRTGNHVMYRVTPVFEGNNLLASGVLMEAKSVEDNGRGVSFNVYCYNVQPHIVIDYATGDSSLSEAEQVSQQEAPATGETYAVNSRNGKIHMVGACPATGSGDDAMTRPVYFATYEEAEAYSAAIEPDSENRKCKSCWKS